MFFTLFFPIAFGTFPGGEGDHRVY